MMSAVPAVWPVMGARGGILLPKHRGNTRIAADRCQGPQAAMDRAAQTCSMTGIVTALSLWALFASLYRYPSPIGRPCFIPNWPSIFCLGAGGYTFRRRVAQLSRGQNKGFDAGQNNAICGNTPLGKTKRGESICSTNSNLLYLCVVLAGWWLAEIRLSSRRSSGPVPDSARLRCWIRIWRPVRPSVRRATCSIARPGRGGSAAKAPFGPCGDLAPVRRCVGQARLACEPDHRTILRRTQGQGPSKEFDDARVSLG